MGKELSKLYYEGDLAEFYIVVKRGDVLQFPRGIYSHYGVYIGWYKGQPHMVVHLTTPGDDQTGLLGWIRKKLSSNQSVDSTLEKASLLYEKASGKEIGNVYIDSVKDVMGPGGSVRIRNDYDEVYQVDEADNICNRALQKYNEREEKPEQYSLPNHNCQHFANGTRYQQERSQQVEDAAIAGGVIGGLLVVGAAGLAYKMISDHNKEEEKRRY